METISRLLITYLANSLWMTCVVRGLSHRNRKADGSRRLCPPPSVVGSGSELCCSTPPLPARATYQVQTPTLRSIRR
jgi:hypothetical protein